MGTIFVGDEYRTNELSLIPGGVSVTAVYRDGTKRIYSNVKKVSRFAYKVKQNSEVVKILVKDVVYWERKEK